jgi:methionine-rich copper-binding protein CopC
VQATNDHVFPRFTGLIALLAAIALFAVSPARPVSAHAEPERADPPINGRVATPPQTLQVWFSEEVETNTAVLKVTGPDGSVVDLGDTTVDLYDPEHKHVTVSLKSGLSTGNYVVEWTTTSVDDGDTASGFFGFYIEQGDASPAASPVASPAATPAAATPAPASASINGAEPTPTVAATAPDLEEFDTQAFMLAIGAGIVAAIGIFLFWRAVKPKKPAVS